MIELLNRQQGINLNNEFGSFILKIQDEEFNPLKDQNKIEPGLIYLNDSDELPTEIDQDFCDRLNKEKFEIYSRNRDFVEYKLINKPLFCELVLTIEENNIHKYVDLLSNSFEGLSRILGLEKIMFLTNFNTPWLTDKDNDYEPVEKSYDYLAKIGVSDEFNGAIIAEGKDLISLMSKLFWIIRCNSSLPTIYLSGLRSSYFASICNEGNIHFYLFSKVQRDDLIKSIEGTPFKVVLDGVCNTLLEE